MSLPEEKTPHAGGSNQIDGEQVPHNVVVEHDTQIHSVNRHVKVPPFWSKNPQLWFHQLDAQFSICRITSEQIKFNYVIAALEMDVLSQVADIIQNPPREPYVEVRTRLIASFGESEERRIKRLLKELELGDKRPSHLLQEMRQIAGTLVSDDFLKSLWIQQLPSAVRAVISASSEQASVLAILADRVFEVTHNNCENYAISTSSSNSGLSEQFAALQQQVSSLTKQISQLQSNRNSRSENRSNSRNRNGSRGRSNSRARNDETDGMCWYHRRFASNATKCTKPCSYDAEN